MRAVSSIPPQRCTTIIYSLDIFITICLDKWTELYQKIAEKIIVH